MSVYHTTWNDSLHGVQPATNFKQVPPSDYYRAMECVNAMAGIENPAEFVELAKFNFAGPIKAKPISPTTLTETDRDNLCDML